MLTKLQRCRNQVYKITMALARLIPQSLVHQSEQQVTKEKLMLCGTFVIDRVGETCPELKPVSLHLLEIFTPQFFLDLLKS